MERRPKSDEYGAFYRPYIAAVPDGPIVATLNGQRGDLARVMADVSPDRERYRYAPGKWSVREIVGHLTDSERMFAMRAMAFARGDSAHYPGFDENEYAAASGADERLPLRNWSRNGMRRGTPRHRITVQGTAG